MPNTIEFAAILPKRMNAIPYRQVDKNCGLLYMYLSCVSPLVLVILLLKYIRSRSEALHHFL